MPADRSAWKGFLFISTSSSETGTSSQHTQERKRSRFSTASDKVVPVRGLRMIRKVAVLGAGTMGAQIAGHVANAGLGVLLLDVTTALAQAALKGLAASSPPALFKPDKI